jgi:hypothetical protein
MQITLSERVMNSLRQEASELEISPNTLARMQLCQINRVPLSGNAPRAYIVRVKNWRDIEAYIEERGFENMDNFLNKAAEWYMKKYHLSAVQKAGIDKNIEKREKAPADASAGL